MAKPFEKAYAMAVRYLARRARSRFEMARYLDRKATDPEIRDQVLSRLEEEGYLNDREFARQFIAARIRFKPKSTYALGYELKAKGIDQSLASELLASFEDLDLAVKAVEHRRDQWRRLDPEECKKKLMNYLRYRGFDYGTCTAVWEKCFSRR